MTLAQALQCEKRDVTNTGYLRGLKRNGWIPGVIYGKDQESLSVMLPGKDLEKIFQRHGYHGLFSIQMAGEKAILVLVRDYQKHPISGKLVHVDFLSVKADVKIDTEVTIQVVGEEELIRNGLILQLVSRSVQVSCLPGDIPETFSLDVSGLNAGDKVTVADMGLPDHVELVTEPDLVIVTVSAPNRAAAEQDEMNLEKKEPAPAEGE